MEVGSNVQDIHIGDRVFTHHHVSCKQCHLCKSGSETLCEHYSKSNLQPCGLAEEYVVPEWNVRGGGVLKLPDSVGFDNAAMIEPLACCVRAWSVYMQELVIFLPYMVLALQDCCTQCSHEIII